MSLLSTPRQATSLARLLSGWAAGGIGFVVVWLGGWWFTVAVGLIVHLGLLEYFRMAQSKGIRPATKTTLVAVQLLLFTTQAAPSDVAAAVLPASGAVICGWLLLQPVTGTIADIAASVFGLVYLGFLPSHWITLRALPEEGLALTLLACFLIVATDIGSYVIGRRLGRRPLSPISPGKTVEGALGGVGCALGVGAIGGSWIGWQWGWLIGAGLGAVVAVFALVGDLTESMMKRDAGLKDSGDAIRGHGGILDRIDSYLFVPAVVYALTTLVLPFLQAGF